MGSIKQKIKNFLIHNKYKCKNVKFHKSTIISWNSKFGGNNRIGKNTFFNGEIGNFSYIGNNCNISAKIGNFSCLGSNINVVNGYHPIKKWVSIHPAFFSTKKQAGISFVKKTKFEEQKYYNIEDKI